MLSSRLLRPIARVGVPALQRRNAGSLARATVVGHVGWIQEELVNPTMMNYSIAVNQKIKGEEVTQWYNINVYGETPVRVASELLRKGSLVFVEGEMRVESYTDKTGNPNKSVSITQQTMRLLRSPAQPEEGPGVDSE